MYCYVFVFSLPEVANNGSCTDVSQCAVQDAQCTDSVCTCGVDEFESNGQCLTSMCTSLDFMSVYPLSVYSLKEK